MNDTLPSSNHSTGIALIFILTILSIFGVIFMIFGPMMRSESMKRIDNFIFGRNSQTENRLVDGLEYYES